MAPKKGTAAATKQKEQTSKQKEQPSKQKGKPKPQEEDPEDFEEDDDEDVDEVADAVEDLDVDAKDEDKDDEAGPSQDAGPQKSAKELRKEKKARMEQARRDKLAADKLADSEFDRKKVDILDEEEAVGGPEGNDIHLHNYSLFMGGKQLLKDVDMTLAFGRRYGLVGYNGTGKTTLLRAMYARDGNFKIARHLDMLLVEQEIAASTKSALDMVVDSDETRRLLLEEEQRLIKEDEAADEKHKGQNSERLARVYERLEVIGASSARARASAILSGLQFSEEMKDWPTEQFSGGWRMRISLARALFLKPRVLMLDEPTNHLDLHALVWLERYLQGWTNTLIVVSHDRDFLTTVCTDIIQIWQEKLYHYKGNYEVFAELFKQKLSKHQEDYEKQQKRLKALKQSGKLTNKATNTTGRETSAGRKEKNLLVDKKSHKAKGKSDEPEEKVELLQPIKDYRVNLFFTSAGPLPMPLLSVTNVTFGYDKDHILFENVEFGINMDSRIAIVGPNGTGKSTLMKLMDKEIEPITGNVWQRNLLRIGVYSQHSTDKLDLDKTPVQYIRDKFPEVDYQTARKYLGTIGLPGFVHENLIRTLSGGQKSRVVLVELQLAKSHILLLDEPTNHLDLETIDGLVEALKEFEGGIVVITHNISLISEVCNEIFVCGEDKSITKFNGEFDDYVNKLVTQMDERERVIMAGLKH